MELYPKQSQGVNTVWRWGKEKALQNITDSADTSNLIARESKDSYIVFEKYRKTTRLARTIWDEKDFYTSKGTKHLKELFESSVFDYPKPELLIARIIDIATQKGDRVMDFFVGSGTTSAVAHKAGRTWIIFPINQELRGAVESTISTMSPFFRVRLGVFLVMCQDILSTIFSRTSLRYTALVSIFSSRTGLCGQIAQVETLAFFLL